MTNFGLYHILLYLLLNIKSINSKYRDFPESAKKQIERGRASYVEIIANATVTDIVPSSTQLSTPAKDVNLIANESVTEGDCWKFVLEEVESLDLEKCEGDGDSSRSLIALARTRCFFFKSQREFPTVDDGCILNPRNISQEMLTLKFPGFKTNPCKEDYKSQACERLKLEIVKNCTRPGVLSNYAFQIYHSDLNHIDDICFYLQSTAWRTRTENNINKLGESAREIIESHNIIQDNLNKLKLNQQEQITQSEWMNKWLSNIKEELNDVFELLITIKRYQNRVLDLAITFKTTSFYLFFLLVVFILTSGSPTKSLRFLMITHMIGSWLLEITFNKILNSEIVEFIKMRYLGDLTTSNILCSRISQLIRLSLGISCSRLWLKSLMMYESPEDILKREIKDLKKMISNSQQWVLKTVKQDDTLTLEDYVATYNSEASSEGSYVESDVSSDTYYSESLGSDSEDLVDEYLEELAQVKRNRRMRQYNFRN